MPTVSTTITIARIVSSPSIVRAIEAGVDRDRRVLFALLAAAYLLAFNGQWQLEPDSALYLTLARNLANGRGYTYHGLAQNLVYPGLPYTLAVLFRVASPHAIAVCDAFILACGLTALALTYRLFYLACGRPTAVVLTLLTGIAYEWFRYCFEIMAEMPFLVGVMAVLAGYEAIFHSKSPSQPRWWDWALFAGGVFIAAVIKPMMLVLLTLCVVAAWWEAWKQKTPRRALCVTGIVVGMIFLFYCFEPRHPLAGTGATSYERIAERDVARLPEHWRSEIADHLSDLLGSAAARSVFGMPLGNFLLNTGFGLVILCAGIASWRFRPLWGMWVAATILKLLVLYSDDRYLVPILPLLMFGWWRVLLRLPADGSPGAWRWSAALRNAAFLVLIGGTFITNAVASGRIVIHQHLTPFIEHYRDGHLLSLSRMADDLTRLTVARDIVLAPAKTSRILTYLSDRIVIEPGHPAVDPGEGRGFVIEEENPPDADMGPWMRDIHVVAIGPPLVIEPNLPEQGGRLALYSARISLAVEKDDH